MRILSALLLLSVLEAPLQAQESADDSAAATVARFEAGLRYQTGTVQLPNGLATLTLPATLRFLPSRDAARLLTQAWGNPPSAVEGVLGMIVPSDMSPLSAEGWGTIVTFEDDGHVNDGDAATMDFADLLRTMREGLVEENKQRREGGFHEVQLIGWAEQPHYDAASHKLYWAKELSFSGSDHHTVNYNIRILGRSGVLVLNAVGSMEQLDLIHKTTPAVLAAVEFNEGHRYADFTSGEKEAAYGIGGLILGGVAAKAGLFKVLWVGLLAAKKFIILGFAAAVAWFKKRFGAKKEGEGAVGAS